MPHHRQCIWYFKTGLPCFVQIAVSLPGNKQTNKKRSGKLSDWAGQKMEPVREGDSNPHDVDVGRIGHHWWKEQKKQEKKNIGIDTLWNMCRAVPCESVCVRVRASMRVFLSIRPSLKEQCCFCMPYIAQCKCVSLHVDVVSFFFLGFSSVGRSRNSCRGFHGCVCFIMVFVLCVSETGIFGGS